MRGYDATVEMPTPSDRALVRLEELAEELSGDGVTRGSMFGMPSLRIGKKVLCSIWADDLVVKLPPGALEDALALDGAERFEPMEGRAMKEWARVPFAHEARWARLVASSLGYVAGG
jgi:hypothetical protein